MNYYFLLEDSKSFYNLLPKWLEYVGFGCELVKNINFVNHNNYILESGHGVTQLETKALYNTINTILDNPNVFDKLIVIVDAEDIGYTNRRQRILNEIYDEYSSKGIQIPCSIHVFVCNRCAETWFLGCRGIYPKNKNEVNNTFLPFYNFYDIESYDPELMGKPTDFCKSISSYHFQYLHTLTQGIAKKCHRSSLIYRKDECGCVGYKEYFMSMVNRINYTTDISSFKEFYDFIISEKQNNN